MLSPSDLRTRLRPLQPRFEVPQALRALVRARASGILVLGALVGALAGLVVAGMSFAVALLHVILIGVAPGARLSALEKLVPIVALSVPTFGGMACGLGLWALMRW